MIVNTSNFINKLAQIEDKTNDRKSHTQVVLLHHFGLHTPALKAPRDILHSFSERIETTYKIRLSGIKF